MQVLKLYLLLKELVTTHSKNTPADIEVSQKGKQDAEHLRTSVIPWFDGALQLWLTDLKQSLLLHLPIVADQFFKNPAANVSLMPNVIAEVRTAS